MEQENLVTLEGLKKMEDELEHLKTVRRKEIAGRIKQAIEFGDISENSEYEDAKNEQAFIEGSILNLEKKLRNAKLIDETDTGSNIVSVGCTVTVFNEEKQLEATYTIVGSVESNPFEHKISNESPVGKGLLGRKCDEVVAIQVPSGEMHFKILGITRG